MSKTAEKRPVDVFEDRAGYVTITKSGVYVDVTGYLGSDRGKEALKLIKEEGDRIVIKASEPCKEGN